MGVGGVLETTTASAQARWELTWESPVGCPQREEVLATVRDIVGESLADTTTLRAQGRIRQVNGAYRLELRVEDEDGARVRALVAKVCSDLLGASAVVLGLQVKRFAETHPSDQATPDPTGPDPHSTASKANEPATAPSKNDGATAPGTEPPKRPTEADPGDDVVESPTARNRLFFVGLPVGAMAWGSLPEPAWLVGMALGLHQGGWRAWLAGRYQLPQSIAAEAVPEVEAVIDRYSAEAGVSHGWSSVYFELAPTMVAGVDYLVARGTGDDITSSSVGQIVPFVGGGLTARWLAADWFAVAAGALVEVPLSRPFFTVRSLGEIGQLAPVHARISAGFEWNF